MGVSVSANLLDLSVRRRSSRESRGSRTSLLRNPILDPPSQRPPSPSEHRRLSDPPPSKPPPSSSATATTTRKDSAQESSPHIVRDHRTNSNTLNSLHVAPFSTDTGSGQFHDAAHDNIVADIQETRPIEVSPVKGQERVVETATPATEKVRQRSLLSVDVNKSVAHSAPPTAMRHASPHSPLPRTLRWADAPFMDEIPTAIAASPPPVTAGDGFNPWGLRHCASLSSTEGNEQSKAVLATSQFKATHQRLCEEPRSRGSSTSASKSARNSREERRTTSTQLSTEEWSRLLDMMGNGNALICVDDNHSSSEGPRAISHASPTVGALPAYPPTDTTPAVDETPLVQNVSTTATEDVRFSPLRMRFSSTGSFVSTGANPEMDLQRAISAVDSYAANLRRLLTSWQDITDHHYEDVVREMRDVLTARHPSYGSSTGTTSAEEHVRVMLQMLGQAVQLVSKMEDMFAVLLEMGAMHRRNDVSAGHFDALHQAFMEVLPRHVAPDQRETLCEAVWEPFWQVVVRLLEQGSRTERGEWYAAQRKAEWMAEARAVMEVVAAQQDSVDTRGTFMPAMLDRAEAANAAMAQFHLMRELRTATRSFEGLAAIALDLTDEEERLRYIEQLAHDHIVYGLSDRALREVRQPFIDTCADCVRRSACPQAWQTTSAESLGLFWDMIAAHWMEGIAVSRRSLADIRSLSAPSGSRPFCMMFTDVEASTRLWELYPSTMSDAMDAHNRLLRRLIAEHGAYEVKMERDAFVIAAKDVFAALQVAVAIQLELMRQPIVEDFRMVPVVQGGGLRSCWREDSLRVRIGIHYCTDASAVYDSVQRRFDYYGPSVNCAARVAAAAAGGQILITQDAVDALRESRAASAESESPMPIAEIPRGSNPMDAVLNSLLEFQWWGEQRFRGLGEPVSLYSVLPMRLAGRTFPYYVGSRKVRVSAPCDIAGRKEVCRLSLTQLKCGNIDASELARLRTQ